MSKDKTGALITFERRQSLQDFINTGVKVSASIKAELLTTIFYEGTPLHDGATIIKNDIVRLIITVEDSGIGIDSDKLGSLFVNEKDYKEENYDLNDTLYNVKKIITLMNGTIIPSSIYGILI